jgi:hypothetical protein
MKQKLTPSNQPRPYAYDVALGEEIIFEVIPYAVPEAPISIEARVHGVVGGTSGTGSGTEMPKTATTLTIDGEQRAAFVMRFQAAQRRTYPAIIELTFFTGNDPPAASFKIRVRGEHSGAASGGPFTNIPRVRRDSAIKGPEFTFEVSQ